MKGNSHTSVGEVEMEGRRRQYDQIMAEVMAAMPAGPEQDWWRARNEVERRLTVPVDVFRTWYHYETGRLEAARSFLKRRGLAGGRLNDCDVLDVGCGYGGMLIACAEEGARVWGVEPVLDAMRWAGRRLETHGLPNNVQQGTAEKLPYDGQSMDVVLLMDVIEHVGSHSRALCEIHRVLRPGGTLLLTAPNRFSKQYLKSDPHYGMPLVCALPPWLGRPLVVHVARRSHNYTVGRFPVCTSLVRLLERLGFTVTGGTHAWRDGCRGWTRVKRTLRVNVLEGAFYAVAEKRATTG